MNLKCVVKILNRHIIHEIHIRLWKTSSPWKRCLWLEWPSPYYSQCLRLLYMSGYGGIYITYIVNLIFAILEIRRWKTFLKSKLLFFRYIKNDQNIIMLNLCSSLILSYIIFLSAVERTENEVHVHEYTKSSMLNISIVNTTAYLTNTFNLLTNWFN